MNFTKHLSRYREELELKSYASSSVELYIGVVYKFLQEFNCEPSRINESQIKEWLRQSPSISTLKIRIGALKNFYKRVVRQPLKFKYIEYPRAEKKLPRVIDNETLKQKILAIKNKKHRAILAVAYCCALRVSEVVNLKVKDIDGVQKLVLIRQSKGKKDRYVGISENCLNILRGYFIEYRPKEYLFEGQQGGRYTAESCNAIYHKYIDCSTSFHNLRHSSITSMIESGANILPIGAAVGHNNPRTTAIYYHVSKRFLASIPAPL